MKNLVCLSIFMFFLASCSEHLEEKNIELQEVSFVFEAPLAPGSNSAQAEINTKKQILTPLGITLDQIETITISTAHISAANGTDLDSLNSLTLQAVGDKVEMKSLAVSNPMMTEDNVAKLNISDEVDLLPYFSEPTFYLLLDAGLKKMSLQNIELKGKLFLNLKVIKP